MRGRLARIVWSIASLVALAEALAAHNKWA